jgi:threonine synthase
MSSMSSDVTNLPEVQQNPHFVGFSCVICGQEQARDYAAYVCPDCGVDGILDVVYDYDKVCGASSPGGAFAEAGAGGLWRFAPLLPVQPAGPHAAWTLGSTPLHDAPRLAAHLGQKQLLIKDDTSLPSASLKDRAAAVAIAHARLLGVEHLACASTGNAAASLAVLTARAGLRSTIFVPAKAPAAKLAQLLLHGATVVPVDGTYDQAFDLSLAEIKKHGWYSRNCAHNPLLVEGKKTVALEIGYALTRGFHGHAATWPDAVLVPVGDGCIISAVAKGFAEMHKLGWAPSVPRIIGVQAAGASPLAQAWAGIDGGHAQLTGPEIRAAIAPTACQTIADSISVGIPRNRIKAWRRVAATGGGFLSVPDEAIVEAIGLLAAQAGVFAEPSGAAGLAGLLAARDKGWITAGQTVVTLVTGHGLKDPSAGLIGVDLPTAVPPLPAD